MDAVNILDARNSLSRLIAAAERGEDVVIARRGRPVVRLVAVSREPTNTGRALGEWFLRHPPLASATADGIEARIAENREAGA